MTTTSILDNELRVILSLINIIKVDTFREIDYSETQEIEISEQYFISFKLRVKLINSWPWPEYLREVSDLEMIYTDDQDHEVALTPTQEAYACKELENKILITG